jgi:hypothetical protein
VHRTLRESPPSEVGGTVSCASHPGTSRYSDAVHLPSGRVVLGSVLLLLIAAGFEFEIAWLFVGALVIIMIFFGYLLFVPSSGD